MISLILTLFRSPNRGSTRSASLEVVHMNPLAPARGFVAAFFVAPGMGFGLASRAAAQIQYSTVALSGQQAPPALQQG